MSLYFKQLRNQHRLEISKCLYKLKIGSNFDICNLIYDILDDLYEDKYLMNKVILYKVFNWKPSLDIIVDEYRLTSLLRGNELSNGVNWCSWLNKYIIIDILAKIADLSILLSSANYGFYPFNLNDKESCYIFCKYISKKKRSVDFKLNRCKECNVEFKKNINYNHFCWWCKSNEGHYTNCLAMTIIYSSYIKFYKDDLENEFHKENITKIERFLGGQEAILENRKFNDWFKNL